MGIDEAGRLAYVVVEDVESHGIIGQDDFPPHGHGRSRFRYTRQLLASAFQLMGCKPRHAFKMSNRAFDILAANSFRTMAAGRQKLKVESRIQANSLPRNDKPSCPEAIGQQVSNLQFLGYMDCAAANFQMITIKRVKFVDVLCRVLADYQYFELQRGDINTACRVHERKTSVIVLLCGTSGCGKSTLASLLAGRLGITTVVSTDSIRHMMRSFADEAQNPLLWASTYHAGECLDIDAVVKAKALKKRKDGKEVGGKEVSGTPVSGFRDGIISAKELVVQGFKAQSEMVIENLDRLMTRWEERKESAIVEGVHLSLNFVMGLMRKHPTAIPFMVHIQNETKHMERFAVRSKYMTLDPARNKYVKYIRNIRTIQEYLCARADKHLVPKVNNTNVDKSVAAIHATVFACLRRKEAGAALYDAATNKVPVIFEEYEHQYAASGLTSKRMLQVIREQSFFRRQYTVEANTPESSSFHDYVADQKSEHTVASPHPVVIAPHSTTAQTAAGEQSLGSSIAGPTPLQSVEALKVGGLPRTSEVTLRQPSISIRGLSIITSSHLDGGALKLDSTEGASDGGSQHSLPWNGFGLLSPTETSYGSYSSFSGYNSYSSRSSSPQFCQVWSFTPFGLFTRQKAAVVPVPAGQATNDMASFGTSYCSGGEGTSSHGDDSIRVKSSSTSFGQAQPQLQPPVDSGQAHKGHQTSSRSRKEVLSYDTAVASDSGDGASVESAHEESDDLDGSEQAEEEDQEGSVMDEDEESINLSETRSLCSGEEQDDDYDEDINNDTCTRENLSPSQSRDQFHDSRDSPMNSNQDTGVAEVRATNMKNTPSRRASKLGYRNRKP